MKNSVKAKWFIIWKTTIRVKMISSTGIKEKTQEILKPFAKGLGNLGISPNTVTLTGFLLSAVSGYFLSTGSLITGTITLIFSGLCDVFDGILARTTERTTKRGAFLDSFLDRYADFFPLAGLLYLGHRTGSELLLLSSLFSIVGSFSTSYARARAESLGIDCKIGLLERPERIILMIAGLISGFVEESLFLLAVLSNFTALQRLICVLRSSD